MIYKLSASQTDINNLTYGINGDHFVWILLINTELIFSTYTHKVTFLIMEETHVHVSKKIKIKKREKSH